MCGIVGYIGSKPANHVIINGLKKLEYRGYDSVGVALVNEDKTEIEIFKDKGRILDLEIQIDKNIKSHFAIGHTRWATHGEPNKVNSHPHMSNSGRVVVVHNGVIENYNQIKKEKLKGYNFVSETDTEVVANLIELYSKIMPMDEAILAATAHLKGSYALLVLDKMDLNKLYFIKNKAPLLIGQKDDEIIIASDIVALVGYTDKYMYLEDMTFGIVMDDKIILKDFYGKELSSKMVQLQISCEEIEKGNYEHFMLKEINEQPTVIRKLIYNYTDNEKYKIDKNLIKEIKKADKLYIVACGSSLYAGYIAKYYFEKILNISIELCIASEAAYLLPKLSKKPFFIFISQSGETADCIKVLKNIKDKKIKTLAITNNIDSTMIRLSDYNLNLYAGKEIAVASTKAYLAQVTLMYILASSIAKTDIKCVKKKLNIVAMAIEDVLGNREYIRDISRKMIDSETVFYIGRGLDYYVSLEAALKLKEISYIHAEGYASGELKHGSIALVNEDVPVVAIITNKETELITRSNLIETTSRKAIGITIVLEEFANEEDDMVLSNVDGDLSPLVTSVVCQLLAYYVSLYKGNDIDKPKNLAKSVTVE